MQKLLPTLYYRDPSLTPRTTVRPIELSALEHARLIMRLHRITFFCKYHQFYLGTRYCVSKVPSNNKVLKRQQSTVSFLSLCQSHKIHKIQTIVFKKKKARETKLSILHIFIHSFTKKSSKQEIYFLFPVTYRV